MTKILSDSFDTYSQGSFRSDGTSYGAWTGQTGDIWFYNSISRFGIGNGTRLNGTLSGLNRPDASGRSTYFFAAALRSQDALNGGGTMFAQVVFMTGSSVQFYVDFCNDGIIRCYRDGGAFVTQFVNAVASQTWEHWQIKVVISDGTGGSIRLRKDGSTTDTFVATGLNTRSYAPSTCDGIRIAGSSVGSVYMDDVLFWDDSPASLPNDWIGDIRSYPLYARAAGSATDFTPYAAPVLKNSTGSSSSFATGTTRLFQFTSDYTGTVASLGVTLATALTGKLNAAIYSDSGSNTPNARLGTATELTNPTIGVNTITFGSPVSVVAGTKYWIAYASDATVVLNNTGSSGATFSAAYASAFPASAPTVTTGVACMIMTNVAYIPTNFSAVNQAAFDGDTSFNYSHVVGATDYYQYDPLPYTPAYVLMVNVKSIARKSDTNPRSLRNQLKSGASVVSGVSTNLSTSYRTLESSFFVDPATSLPWTKSAIDALQVGPNVVA